MLRNRWTACLGISGRHGPESAAGRIRLIFVADQVPRELQRVVEFLNTQMDPAEVLAVEIPRFSGSGLETLVPRVIGQTEGARSKKSGAGGTTGRQWDRTSFLQEVAGKVGQPEAELARTIMDWAEREGLRASFGQGARSGSFFPVLDNAGAWYAPFALWTYGQVETQFQYLKARPEFSDVRVRQEMIRRFNELPGVELPADGIERRPSFPIGVLAEEGALRQFLSTAEWIVDQVRS